MDSRINHINTPSEDLLQDQLRLWLKILEPPEDLLRTELLSTLPDELLRMIGEQLSSSDVICLTNTSKHWHSFFSDDRRQALEKLHRLLKHGVLREHKDAENIWRANPGLLTYPGTIEFLNRSHIGVDGKPLNEFIDISFYQNPGRPKNTGRTFYQILIRNSEFKEAIKVGKHMTLGEKQKQFHEIFPDREMKKYNFDLDEVKRLLENFSNKLSKDKIITDGNNPDEMSASTQIALHAIYDYAKLQLEDETGIIFDPRFLQEAMRLHDKDCTFRKFKNNFGKYRLWRVRVEGWLRECSGTGYLHPISSQDFKDCNLADGSSCFASHRPCNSIPGFHCRVDMTGRVVDQTSSKHGFAARARQGAELYSHFYLKDIEALGKELYKDLGIRNLASEKRDSDDMGFDLFK